MRRMLGQKVRSTRHNAVRDDGQLVTPFYGARKYPPSFVHGNLPRPHFSAYVWCVQTAV